MIGWIKENRPEIWSEILLMEEAIDTVALSMDIEALRQALNRYLDLWNQMLREAEEIRKSEGPFTEQGLSLSFRNDHFKEKQTMANLPEDRLTDNPEEARSTTIGVRVRPFIKKRLQEESRKPRMTLTEFLMDCIVAGWGVITGQEKASNNH